MRLSMSLPRRARFARTSKLTDITTRYAGRHPYMSGLGMTVGALAVATLLNVALDVPHPSRIFLVGVMITAVTVGLWPALFACLISALFYDFFFLPPTYSLAISNAQGIVDFCFFVATAVIVTSLAARVRRYALEADQRALSAETLSDFGRRLADALTVHEVLDRAAERMSICLEMPVVLVIPETGRPSIRAGHPPHIAPDSDCLRSAIAWWALRPRGSDRDQFVVGDWRFRPLSGSETAQGLIARRPGNGSSVSRAGDDRLLDALAHQTALAVDRCTLRDDIETIRVRSETERLHSAVLSSISHDLRNPLASIVGSASGLEYQWRSLDDESRLLLIRTIRREAERLDTFVGKLLDITRIEAKVVVPLREPVLVSDVVEAALRQADGMVSSHRVAVVIAENLPPIEADMILLRQVLYNLIENASKYSSPGSGIRIVACWQGQEVRISVLDEGVGILEADVERIFNKFYRSAHAGAGVTGGGLGLAICRGFLDAMGGTIEAANRDDRVGAVFVIKLPAAIQVELSEAEQ
jgi:two-component system sensor histidine kinase KdpD